MVDGLSDHFIGRNLVDVGIITKAQLLEAEEEHLRSGKLLAHILIDFGFVKQSQILEVIGKHLGMEMVDVRELNIPQEVLNKITPSTAKLYRVFPIRVQSGTITIAMADPLNPTVLDDLRFILGCDVKGAIANEADVDFAIEKYYSNVNESMEDLLAEMESDIAMEVVEGSDVDLSDITSLRQLAQEAPVVKLLNLILIQAIKEKASDIHFEPFEDEFKVRYRIDGALYEMVPPPKNLALAITSRIKVMADMDISERRLPQDGKIQLNVAGRDVDLRISTLPTQFGESVVIRILDKSVVSLDLEQLGLEKDHILSIRELIAKPNGIIILTGPTGSGKTTTLYSCLKEINQIDVKIITTEDPIEYEIEGIIQVAINSAIDLTFARCLRSILRQDPDKIMVGEIRDLETAQISVQSSLTGHLVFSTLHTNDAPGAITRLLDMGIEPFLITSTLQAVIAQRLVRLICENCKEQIELPLSVCEQLGISERDRNETKFFRGKGCDKCHGTGYHGRNAIFETLIITDPIRELILQRAPSVEIKQKARELGMRLLRDDAVLKLLNEKTTAEEILRET
ncbi:MAG: ATPase, T2SS/T4P/T4SS family [Chlamydiota bacterium]|nr:ATPase, T2SS/T4P/T4SS family [Chlamydiota bacterium]